MAQGLFITGFTITEVLAIQSKAKEMLMEGKTLMAWGDSGMTTSKQFPMTVKETLEECTYALRVLDPVTYGHKKTIAVSSIVGYLPK